MANQASNQLIGIQNRVEIVRDTRVLNAITVKISKEDHTIGNLLRQQLLKDPRIVFTGYKVPHPLMSEVHVKLQTGYSEPDYAAEGINRPNNTAFKSASPEDVLTDSIDHLINHLKDIQDSFEAAFSTAETTSPQTF